jgi:hypothetical protein
MGIILPLDSIVHFCRYEYTRYMLLHMERGQANALVCVLLSNLFLSSSTYVYITFATQYLFLSILILIVVVIINDLDCTNDVPSITLSTLTDILDEPQHAPISKDHR